jgi:uncharacterized membrane protein
MAEHYLILKWLHIVGAAVLFGTGLGIAFNFWLALRASSVAVIAAAARATVIADFVFTLPAVALQPITGIALALDAGYPLLSTWIVSATLLYLVAGACWIPVVFIQLKMRDLAVKSLDEGSALPAEFHRLARRWFVLGWPAFLAVGAIFWLMIARPA